MPQRQQDMLILDTVGSTGVELQHFTQHHSKLTRVNSCCETKRPFTEWLVNQPEGFEDLSAQRKRVREWLF